ncbi:MAG: ABC transporter substrate-binding protein [Syntrophales bacterium]|jgi:branched-chain amino acid transport system substrate-binding protein|nr:ABC transporter substrate-binding protein [Syntrophales bacterium]MDY0043199.1 ABC transporter substrate-binding protein [Syntrophales bacterium]
MKGKCIAAIGIFFLAFGLILAPQAAVAEKAETINFGIISYLTGPASPWGIPNFRSISMGAEMVNEKGGFKVNGKTYKWKVFSYDSKYIPAEAVKAANKAIYADKCRFLAIGGGACVIACMSLLKSNDILSLDFAGGGKSLTNPDNPLVFRYNPGIENMYAAFYPFLIEKEGIKTVATINPEDETGKSGLAASELLAGINNVEIISKVFFERGSKDFASILTKLIAQKPDLIETSYTDPTSAALICKQARELGYKGVILLPWGPDPAQVIKIAGPHAEGVYMAVAGPIEPQNEAQQAIYDRFVSKWPAKEWDPNIWPHTELVPCLTKAIEATQSFDSATLAKYLEDATWDSPFGELSFGLKGVFGIKRQLMFPLSAFTVKDGKAVFIGTPQMPKGVLE